MNITKRRGKQYNEAIATFWQKRVHDSNVTLEELASLLGCSYRYATAYLRGYVLPKKETMKRFCNIFGVDEKEGIQEFYKAFEAWGETHKDTHVKYSNTYKPKKPVKSSIKITEHKRHRQDVGFWAHKIASSGMSYTQISDLLGIDVPTFKGYLSGAIMPNPETIKIFCREFNVDYDRAYKAFVRSHNLWVCNHVDSYEKSGDIYVEKVTTPIEKIEQTGATLSVMDCLKAIYGKLSCEDFVAASNLHTSYAEFLGFVYGKVDFKTFNSLVTQ